MGYRVAKQVRFLEKTVDLVGARAPRPDLVTVELKVMDWQRAVRQAYLNQVLGRQAYIAIHDGFVHRVDTRLLESAGIGLMRVGMRAQIVLEPRRSKVENGILASRLWGLVMET